MQRIPAQQVTTGSRIRLMDRGPYGTVTKVTRHDSKTLQEPVDIYVFMLEEGGFFSAQYDQLVEVQEGK